MKTRIPLLVLGLPFLATLFAGKISLGESATVTGANAFLRDEPDGNARVVGELQRGDRVEILGESGDGDTVWVRVVPPSTQDLWVYADLLDDGKVAVKFAQIRSGGGLDYAVVGRAKLADSLTVRGRTGDWLRIAPPAGTGLWLEKSALAVAGGDSLPAHPPAIAEYAAESEKKPEPARRPVPLPDPRPFRKPDAPARQTSSVSPSSAPSSGANRLRTRVSEDSRFAPASDPGEVSLDGVVRRSGFVFRRPSDYRLVTYDKMGRAVTLCYLDGAEDRLDGFVGARVNVRGRKFHPVGLAPALVRIRRMRVIER